MITHDNRRLIFFTLWILAGGMVAGAARISEIDNGRIRFEAGTGIWNTVEWCADLQSGEWHAGWINQQGIVSTSMLTEIQVPVFYRVNSATDYYDNCAAVQETLMSQLRAELQGPGWWDALTRLAGFNAWLTNRLATLELGSLVTNVPGFGPVEYARMGAGPMLLLSHGGLMGYDNIYFLAAIAQSGFSVLCPSRPGFLRTPLLPGTNDSFELAADMMSGLLDALGVTNRVFICGTSAGGPTALQFALRHPDRTAGLVMMDAVSLPYVADLAATNNFVIPLLVPDSDQDPKSWKLNLGTERYPEETMFQWFKLVVQSNDAYRRELACRLAADPASVARLLQFTRGVTPISRRYAGTINDVGIMAYLPDYPLENITNPVLVTHSYYDGDVPFANATNVYGRVSGPKTNFFFYGGGHLYFLGPDWAEIQQRLLDFLNAHNPGFP